jgi:hypothetical protein|tara:strand:- start:241 stop:417 length:177 start_codon:yes stop_codon:yes gene_type:complete
VELSGNKTDTEVSVFPFDMAWDERNDSKSISELPLARLQSATTVKELYSGKITPLNLA